MTEQNVEIASGFSVVFDGVGSSEFAINILGTVTPNQMLATAEYLSLMAKSTISETRQQMRMRAIQQQNQEPKIQVPKANFKVPNGKLK